MTSIYEKIDVPGAVYFKEMCYASVGPPSVAYYPFHGIFISVNFNSTELGVHVPAGTTVQLNDDTIRIAGTSKSAQFEKSVRIKAFRQGSSGNGDPRQFRRLPDPYGSPSDLGPFVGNSVGDSYVYHFFMGIDENNPERTVSLPVDLIYGTIELPSMTINGQRYDRQTLPFKQTRFSEIAPINC